MSGYAAGSKPETDADKLKIALWYISKFDTADEALCVLRTACKSVRTTHAAVEAARTKARPDVSE